MSQNYDHKGGTYFTNARSEIEPLLAPCAERALEIGCGAGGTMAWLKHAGKVKQAWGMELFESAAEQARAHFETVLAGDAEKIIAMAYVGQRFDLILCLDVLEHMIDPWSFVRQLHDRLAPGGKLVISVPNIRCLRVLLPLALKGRWEYTDEGILDRTHLRFFTRETALRLAAGSELRIEGCLETRPRDSRLRTLDRWTFGALRDLTAVQYLVAASREPAAQRAPTRQAGQQATHTTDESETSASRRAMIGLNDIQPHRT